MDKGGGVGGYTSEEEEEKSSKVCQEDQWQMRGGKGHCPPVAEMAWIGRLDTEIEGKVVRASTVPVTKVAEGGIRVEWYQMMRPFSQGGTGVE